MKSSAAVGIALAYAILPVASQNISGPIVNLGYAQYRGVENASVGYVAAFVSFHQLRPDDS